MASVNHRTQRVSRLDCLGAGRYDCDLTDPE